MTTYIRVPVNTPMAFLTRYFEVVGEGFQTSPPTDGVTYLVGSSRITPDHVNTLATEFPDVVFSEEYPQDFTPNQEGE